MNTREHYRLHAWLVHLRFLVRHELLLHLVGVDLTQLVNHIPKIALLRLHWTLVNEAFIATQSLPVTLPDLKESIWLRGREVVSSLLNVDCH